MNIFNTGHSTSSVLGRAWLYDDEPDEIEIWEHELEPMDLGRRSGAAWCREYLSECCSNLREVLNVPEEGNYQVIFKAKMIGYKVFSIDGDEYEEEFELEESKHVQIPDEYMKVVKR